MCGIIGYKGRKNIINILVKGLKNLEYRGYDSWGIGVSSNKGLGVYKKVGKISDAKLDEIPLTTHAKVGIGHSRWATHGGVTTTNAHPHLSFDKKIAVVHNGIIENYQELKKELEQQGIKFYSETDTEILPNLIALYRKRLNLVDAVIMTLRKIKGRSSFVVIEEGNDVLVGARIGSPLIVGLGKEEYFIASDITAFFEYTKEVNYLDDNQLVYITDKPHFIDITNNEPVKKRTITIDWDISEAQKGDFKHFMIKEIWEQKQTLRQAVNQDEESIKKIAELINNAFGTYFIGCGTAGKVAMLAEYFFSNIADKHINTIFASEFAMCRNFLTKGSLLVSISQSGETADVLEAMKIAKERGATLVSILNVKGSSMYKMSDHVLMINAGPEKAVASTKATTNQMAVVMLLAYAAAGRLKTGKKLLIEVASKVNDMLNPRYSEHIKKLAEKIYNSPDIIIIGRGANYPVALESAIKIQEVSYINAQGFAAGELKHGPIALVEKGTPCIVLISEDEHKHDAISNAVEVKSRGGYIIGVAPENNDVFDYWIKVPYADAAQPIVNVIPIQVLAYHLAIMRGINPDFPRNLAKSVVVK